MLARAAAPRQQTPVDAQHRNRAKSTSHTSRSTRTKPNSIDESQLCSVFVAPDLAAALFIHMRRSRAARRTAQPRRQGAVERRGCVQARRYRPHGRCLHRGLRSELHARDRAQLVIASLTRTGSYRVYDPEYRLRLRYTVPCNAPVTIRTSRFGLPGRQSFRGKGGRDRASALHLDVDLVNPPSAHCEEAWRI